MSYGFTLRISDCYIDPILHVWKCFCRKGIQIKLPVVCIASVSSVSLLELNRVDYSTLFSWYELRALLKERCERKFMNFMLLKKSSLSRYSFVLLNQIAINGGGDRILNQLCTVINQLLSEMWYRWQNLSRPNSEDAGSSGIFPRAEP